MPCTIWLADDLMLVFETITAKTSATPIAMPAPASSSCARCVLRRYQ